MHVSSIGKILSMSEFLIEHGAPIVPGESEEDHVFRVGRVLEEGNVIGRGDYLVAIADIYNGDAGTSAAMALGEALDGVRGALIWEDDIPDKTVSTSKSTKNKGQPKKPTPETVSSTQDKPQLRQRGGQVIKIADTTISSDPGEEGDWWRRANCLQVGGDLHYPEKGMSTREAKKICKGCDVRTECLHEALANDEPFGVWGGLSERERRNLKRRSK